MSIIRQDYGNLADMATQQLLAPIFPTLVATKAVSKDGLFIINNTLYKATADIVQNAQIVVGTNAALASTMAEELMGYADSADGVVCGTPITINNVSRATAGYNTKDIHTITGGDPTMPGKTFIGYTILSSAAPSVPIGVGAASYWLVYYVSSASTGANDTYTLYPLFK